MYTAAPNKTSTKEWRQASKEYLKFQQMNPIFRKYYNYAYCPHTL